MNPPSVYDETNPSSHAINRITAIVYSIWFSWFVFNVGILLRRNMALTSPVRVIKKIQPRAISRLRVALRPRSKTSEGNIRESTMVESIILPIMELAGA